MSKWLIFTVLFSVLCTYFLYFSTQSFVDAVDFFNRTFLSISFGVWELKNIVFAISLSLLPIYAFIAFSITKKKSYLELLKLNGLALLIFILITLILVGLVYLKNSNNLEREIARLYGGSIYFWNFVLAGANGLTLVFMLIIAKMSRITSQRKIEHEMESLDRIK